MALRVQVTAALLAAVFGVFLLNEVTLGLGLIALACLIGILARLIQASQQHRAMMYAMGYSVKKMTSEPDSEPESE